MYYVTDSQYLLYALNNNGSYSVSCPAARASLQKLGYMTIGNIRGKWDNGNPIPNCLVLTPKGRIRAEQIKKQLYEDRRNAINSREMYQYKSWYIKRDRVFYDPNRIFFDNVTKK